MTRLTVMSPPCKNAYNHQIKLVQFGGFDQSSQELGSTYEIKMKILTWIKDQPSSLIQN